MANMGCKILVSGLFVMAGVSTGIALAYESNPGKSLPLAAKGPLIVSDSLKGTNYIGSQACASCHKDVEVETPDKKKVKISPTIKLNRDGDNFNFTLLDKDNPANNQTYPIAYVFGGNWNQHFEAQVDR
jgi:hypothetical protein